MGETKKPQAGEATFEKEVSIWGVQTAPRGLTYAHGDGSVSGKTLGPKGVAGVRGRSFTCGGAREEKMMGGRVKGRVAASRKGERTWVQEKRTPSRGKKGEHNNQEKKERNVGGEGGLSYLKASYQGSV